MYKEKLNIAEAFITSGENSGLWWIRYLPIGPGQYRPCGIGTRIVGLWSRMGELIRQIQEATSRLFLMWDLPGMFTLSLDRKSQKSRVGTAKSTINIHPILQ